MGFFPHSYSFLIGLFVFAIYGFSSTRFLFFFIHSSGSFQNLNALAIWRSVCIQIFEDLSKGIYDDLDTLRSHF